MVFMVIVVGRLGTPELLGPRGLVRIKFNVEWVLVDVLRRSVKQRNPVVSGVRPHVAGDLADIAGQRRQQEDVAVFVVVVEELVWPHADRKQRSAGLLGKVARQ